MLVFDPIAGGDALLVLDIGSKVRGTGGLQGTSDGRAEARVRL